ncbi:MAG: rhomboid family intramembrane serine protease [Phycisphaerae bacterium]|nr:rhomboid family intramembrane serine protease [Tepidisphaeraceae bacterium]
MLFPFRTDVPQRATPWMNYLLILANLVISLWGWKFPTLAQNYELSAREPHLLNFLTYGFLHQPGVAIQWLSVHLIGNLVALWLFGNSVNERLGHVGYLAFYLAGAVFAGVGCVVFPSALSPRVIGASGAVMAVVGAYLVLFPKSQVSLAFFLIFTGGVVEVPAVYLISFFVTLDVAMSLAGSSGVAHMAHAWGVLLGFGVVMSLLSAKLLPGDPFDCLSLLRRWNRRREYQRLVRRGFDPFAKPAAPRVQTAREREAERRARREEWRRTEKIRTLRAQVNEAIAHHNLPHAAIVFMELKTVDPDQVLSRQAQLDVANQLASQQFHTQAADAYEQFLRHYPHFGQIEHVELMLGLIYAKYLGKADRARELLTRAVRRLHGESELRMAREQLERLGA